MKKFAKRFFEVLVDCTLLALPRIVGWAVSRLQR